MPIRCELWRRVALVAGGLLVAACSGQAAPTQTETKATVPATLKTETKTEAKTEANTEAKTEAQTAPKAAASPGGATSPTPTVKAAVGSAKATGEPIKIGQMCDRVGITVNIGTKLCDAFQNWIELVNNSMGGVKGRPVQALEVDHKYEVPIAVDAYKKFVTRDNVPQILSYGTPVTDALAPSAIQDKVVLWTPGFGLSPSADGKKFPYVFVGVATYYSQAMALMDYLAKDWKAQGKTENAKFVYMYLDNPAGRDPLEVIQKESAGLGLDLIDSVAVPATTVDMTTILNTIKEKNPDYIMSHLVGRLPSLSLQAADKVGFPRDRMISIVWGFSEDEVEITKQAAEGYRGLQFTALLSDNPEAYQLLEQYWKDSGQQPNAKRHSVYYARGIMAADIMIEAMRLAEDPTKGESVKKGAESIKDFTAHQMIPGTTLSEEDHGGTRKVRMYQIQNGELKRVQDWFEGPLPKAVQ